MTMKKYLVLPIAICATTFSFAAQSQIPEKYLGNWAEKKSDCIIPPGSPIDFPDAGIKITQDAIHQYEAGCTLKKVISESDNAFSAEFECGDSEGVESVKKILSLSGSGNELTGFDERKLVRCE
jgi:hypothetical protein